MKHIDFSDISLNVGKKLNFTQLDIFNISAFNLYYPPPPTNALKKSKINYSH